MKRSQKPDMKSASLARQLQRLNWLIDTTRRASGDQLELHAHWGRYLCVLVAGFLENAIGEIYSPKLLPIRFLEIHVTIETGGNHKESHFQFKALRGDGMNRLW